MDTVQTLFDEIRAFGAAHGDPERVRKYERFFVEGYDAYGLEQKEMEARRDAWLTHYRPILKKEGFLDLAGRLVGTGKYEDASFALWFTKSFLDELTAGDFACLSALFETGVCNWAHTDMFSLDILAEFLNRGIVPVQALADWRSAGVKWKRRAVAVSLIKVVPGKLSPTQALEFVEPMMMDSEKVVHQGLGWLLRELWKLDAAAVEDFLLLWKDRCARLIVQYATEKMTAEQKVRFKKTRSCVFQKKENS